MALHKIVNGKRIDMSPEEETAFLAQQALDTQEVERMRQENAAHLARKQAFLSKLSESTGYTPEEVSSFLS